MLRSILRNPPRSAKGGKDEFARRFLSFTTGGDQDWFDQYSTYYYGYNAAQSGYIEDYQASWMQTSLDINDQTTVTFYWKVSSESGCDYLQFYIDNVLKDQISGEVGWQQKSYIISTSGSHTLKGQYVKDGSESSGSDCGWVDYVQWAGSPEPPPPPPPTKWQKITYKYDPAGRRIEKTIDGKYTVKYCYDGDDMIAEYHGSGKLLRKYIYGPRVDEPICMIDVVDDNKVYYYHFDGLGSVIALSDEDGNTVQTYEYTVWGEVAAEDVNHPNPIMFTGRWFDKETGLYYYRARYYNPYIGRFLQTDPVGYGYAYCSNNPANLTDSFGLRSDIDKTLEDWGWPYGSEVIPNDTHFALASTYAAERGAFLAWWEGLCEFNRGLLDGCVLTAYGSSFGIIGDNYQIEMLLQRYGSVGEWSSFLGQIGTTATGMACVLQYCPMVFETGYALAKKFATDDPSLHPPRVTFDWSRFYHIFDPKKVGEGGHVFAEDITVCWRWAETFINVASNEDNLNLAKTLIWRSQFPESTTDVMKVYTLNRGPLYQIWVYVLNGMIVDAGVNRFGGR